MSKLVSHQFPNEVLSDIATWMLDEEILSNYEKTFWRSLIHLSNERASHPFLRHMPSLQSFSLTIDFDSDRDAVEFMLRFVG